MTNRDLAYRWFMKEESEHHHCEESAIDCLAALLDEVEISGRQKGYDLGRADGLEEAAILLDREIDHYWGLMKKYAELFRKRADRLLNGEIVSLSPDSSYTDV